MLKHKQRKGFLILTILILLASIMIRPQAGIAEVDSDGKRVVGSGDFQIEINGGGQVPFYHFNVSDTAFFLKFQKIIQYNDTNENRIYDAGELIGGQNSTLQLTSVQWDFIDNSENSEINQIEFAFRSLKINNPFFKDVQIELNNKYYTGALAVKFDIIISGWPFVEEATGLSLEFELMWSQDSEEEKPFSKESNETGVYLYNKANEDLVAYFDITSEIEITIGDEVKTKHAILNDTASEHASKLNIYINYPKFDSLVHDPEFGTSKAALPSLTDPTAIVLWLEENVKAGFLGITVITTLILAALVVIVRTKKHR